MSLHAIVTGHPHWGAFDAEEAKANALLAKSQRHTAKTERARLEWEAATARWEADREDAALNGRDPDESIEYPGEFVAPEPFLGRRRPVELFHQKIGQVGEMRRAWAVRMAPELVGALVARDGEAVGAMRARIAELDDVARELGSLRESMAWVAACGGTAPAPTGLFEVQNLLNALASAVGRLPTASESPDRGYAGIGFDLDGVSIE